MCLDSTLDMWLQSHSKRGFSLLGSGVWKWNVQLFECINADCSLQSPYFEKNKIFKGKMYTFTKKYCFKSGEI